MSSASDKFSTLVDGITNVGFELHAKKLLDHAILNLPYSIKSIKQLPALSGQKSQSAIVISAGPSVHRRESIRRIKESGYAGTIIAVDGAYISCLKQGLIPDYLLTLDPHPRRIVRWFGDPNFEKNMECDDYFSRQDLDVDFRKNSIVQNQQHIEIVDKNGYATKAIVASSAPVSVVERIVEANFDQYWWNPLVDNPHVLDSLTRKLYQLNKLPCMNTGGTVGTAGWVFANSILKIPAIALVGVDLGYYSDTPRDKTQTFYELHEYLTENEDVEQCFVDFEFPLTREKFYADPTYYWYRRNFLELLSKASGQTFNCTEGGTLFGDNVKCVYLDDFLKNYC